MRDRQALESANGTRTATILVVVMAKACRVVRV